MEKMEDKSSAWGDFNAYNNKDHDTEINIMSLPEIAWGIMSSDARIVLQATMSVRRLLLTEENPPIEKVIELGLVDKLVSFLGHDDNPILQCEAAWALANVASGSSEQTRVITRAGAVPHFIRLLDSQSTILVELCVWALGNITGDGAELRDLVTDNGVIGPLLRLVDMSAPPDFLSTVAWTLSNLCRSKDPPPKFHVIQACLPALGALIQHPDQEVVSAACLALSYISGGDNNQIQAVIESPGVLTGVLKILKSMDNTNVIFQAIRTVGHIITGTDNQTQAVLDEGLLMMMPKLLAHSESRIKEQSCWVLSNITAGTVNQIQSVIDHNLLPLIIQVLSTDTCPSKIEAAWAISNITTGGTVEQISYVVQVGGLKAMCEQLASKETKLLNVLLDAITNILKAAENVYLSEQVCERIKEMSGLEKIKSLLYTENVQVVIKAYALVKKYFSQEVHMAR